MTLESVSAFGTGVLASSVVVLWLVLALRTPSAVRSRQQRMLVLAGLGLAGSITVYFAPVTGFLERSFVFADSCGLFMNVWGVFSSALILDFVLAAMSKRRPVLVYGGMVVVSAALVLIDATIDPSAGCVSSVPAPWYSPFWWLLCVAHLVAVIPCAVLCGRYGRRAREDRPVRAGLSLLAAGFASSAVFWTVCLVVLLFRPSWLGPLFPLNIGLTGWLINAGLAVPLVMTAARTVRNLVALWDLSPLWRDLVRAAPHVALTTPRSRLLESLGSVPRSSLRLYRRVIEIRDAILVLRDYADAGTVRRAERHIRALDLPADDVQPAITACWLEFARQAHARRAATGTSPPEFATSGGQDLDGEVRFLRAVRRIRDSSVVRTFLAETAHTEQTQTEQTARSEPQS